MSRAVFKSLFSPKGRSPGSHAPSTQGRLVYAVGDIHGRLDLLTALLGRIDADARATSAQDRPVLVFLGDYVDRGPASREVIDCVRALGHASDFEVRALRGNHEQVMLSFLDDISVGPSWVEFGGGQTLAAYGVTPPPPRADTEAWQAAQEAFVAALPQADVEFIRNLEMSATYGDYMFVHAGVRPDVPLDRQEDADVLWIRHEFLGSERRLEKVIVHGHTPEVEPYLGRARIGVDTGAYATGVLTAVRLLGEERSVLQSRSS